MKNRMRVPEINAGSMADIAFLLLIFFLVTTTFPHEKGITRKLPKVCLSKDCSLPINERNILRINLNQWGDLMLEDEPIELTKLNTAVKEFIENNGDGSCHYCDGRKDVNSSDNPRKAVVVLVTNNKASYAKYIELQNEINKAYFELRNVYAKKKFGKSFKNLIQEELKEVKKAYPLLVSEVDLE